jgi:predicted RNA-binding Zn-ribbon protein involved in translation (DUF1610 family)
MTEYEGLSRTEYNRREAHYDEQERIGPCPECGETDWDDEEYLYGDDADGNRGEWRHNYICRRCGHEL